MKCEIWVSEQEKGLKAINKGLKRPYDGHIPERTFLIGEGVNYSIEEAYIEDDGSVVVSVNGSNGLYFNIEIPFDEWVYQLLRFDSLSKLDDVLKTKNKELIKIQKKIELLKNKLIQK